MVRERRVSEGPVRTSHEYLAKRSRWSLTGTCELSKLVVAEVQRADVIVTSETAHLRCKIFL